MVHVIIIMLHVRHSIDSIFNQRYAYILKKVFFEQTSSILIITKSIPFKTCLIFLENSSLFVLPITINVIYVIFKNMYAYCIFKTTWKLWLNLSFSDKTSKLLLNFITFKIQYCRWDFLMPKILWVEPLKGNNWKWSLKG